MNWPLPIRIMLLPFSWIYGAVVRCKTILYTSGMLSQKRLKGAVISVGNLTVGGTGKTPMVLWLAEKFLSEGKRVAILSRGYGGSGQNSDEVNLLKRRLGGRVRFAVGPDRYAEGSTLEAAEPVDAFLLDDGFQHVKLARDVDIVLIDATQPLRKEFLLPAGRLREPLSGIERATVVVFTRVNQSPLVTPAMQRFAKLPIFLAATSLNRIRAIGEPNSCSPAPKQPVLAFCGIGNPNAFFADLEHWGIKIAGTMVFRDHHRYAKEDLEKLERLARDVGAKSLITTEKDEENLAGLRLNVPAFCCETNIELPAEHEFWKVMKQSLNLAAEKS